MEKALEAMLMVREKNLKEYKRCIDQAVILNVDFVHGYSGGIEGPISEEEEKELWNLFKSGLLEVLDYAKEKGVKFGIEGVIHHLVHGYESVKKMFEFINRDDLYLNYDPCHLFISKPEGGHIKVIEEFGEKVKHVHVHDAVSQAQ